METSEASPAVLPVSTTESIPLVTLNDLLWLLYLYPVRLLARILPRWCLYAIRKLSDPIIQFDARRSRARAAPWIALACRTSPANARRIASRAVSNVAVRTLDGLLLLRPSWESMLRNTGIDGIQHLEDAIARGKGVILLAGHFCANQVALRYLASKDRAALCVHSQQLNNKVQGQLGRRFLRPRFVQIQKRVNPDQIYLEDPDCGLRLMGRLRAGGLVALQIDSRGGSKIEQAFLGVPWRMRTGMFEIVRLSGCAVVPILCLGRSSGFRIRFDPMLEIERADSREAFVSANLPRFLGVVEKQIVENPEEWRLWNHY